MRLMYTPEVRKVLSCLALSKLDVTTAQIMLQGLIEGTPINIEALPDLTDNEEISVHQDARRLNVLLKALVEQDNSFLLALESHANGAAFFNVASVKQAIDKVDEQCRQTSLSS